MKAVSLFTGCGGIDLGLERAGFQVVFANDVEEICRQSYRLNFGQSAVYSTDSVSEIDGDYIRESVGEDLGGLDLLAGGPPCPPYSKSRFYRKEKPRALDDPIGDLTLTSYVRILKDLRPKAFLFENVYGFAYKVHRRALDFLTESAELIGYSTARTVLNAADFGVPQMRKRFFMVGLLDGHFRFPNPTYSKPIGNDSGLFPPGMKPWRSAGDVLCDLDTDENSEVEGHFAGGQHHELLRQVPPGDNYLFFTKERGHPSPKFDWRSRYWSFLLKLSPDRPSWTIQARRSNNMGPFHWRNRILRIEEVKRLQSFPDNFALAGTVEQQWRQLGNAVPPDLAECLARVVARSLNAGRSSES